MVTIQAPPDRLRHLRDLQRRRAERRKQDYPSPLALAAALDPATKSSPALRLIDDALVDLMADDSPHNALAVLVPAQEGKSTICSRRLPEWVLHIDQSAQIAVISYQADIAIRWGREIKRDVALAEGRLNVTIRQDSSAAARGDTPEGGGVYCTGVGGPLTGRSVGRLMVIDDPVKDRADAESATIRESAWSWWESVALTRLGPRSRVVLIMTRFHEDDLAGRILGRPGPLRWRVLKIPAIAEDGDELGRAPGEELESVRGRAPGYFANLRAGMSPYVFSGMYQQNPVAPEGNFFRRSAFRYWRHAEPWQDGRERIACEGVLVTMADCWTFGTVDVAASTRTTADWTVVSAWAVSVEGDLILLDRARARVQQHDHFRIADPLIRRWGLGVLYVEHGFFASTLVKDARDAGYPVAELRADTDKITRAIPAAGRVHAGRVWFPAEAPWLDEWTDELAAFPNGAHDDQVDTLSYAALVVTNQWAKGPDPPREGLSPHERAIAAAYASATGSAGNGQHSDGTGQLDIMGLDY